MTFTMDDVKRVTRELLDEFGEDYVYPGSKDASCFYAVPGTFEVIHEDAEHDGWYGQEVVSPIVEVFTTEDTVPSCLLGHIAYRLDPNLFRHLASVDVDGPCDDSTGYWGSDDEAFMQALGVDPLTPLEDGPTAALFSAQSDQDRGKVWGIAARHILEFPT